MFLTFTCSYIGLSLASQAELRVLLLSLIDSVSHKCMRNHVKRPLRVKSVYKTYCILEYSFV